MDKKSKDPMRRYKKSRHTAARSTTESSSTETESGSSSSYSSSDSEHNRINERHRKKKSTRRPASTSGDERRKRDKRDHCQKKLEAKRNHIKRKLKEAKLKKRAAAALSVGHGNRSLTPTTQAKLKKLTDRKHSRAESKETRERDKVRNVQRDRERDHHRMSRSPAATTTKIRIHQDVKRLKSPGIGGNGSGLGNNSGGGCSGGGGGGGSSSSSSRMHHQLMSREKIIIQARTRDRTPSLGRERDHIDRQRHEHKQQQRHDDLTIRERERRDRERERAEREAARDKERAEALARCQERQRERERVAREKMRREEEEKKYNDVGSSGLVGGNRMRQLSERKIEINGPYGSRERSLEGSERSRHMNKRDLDPYDREPPEYVDAERHNMFDDVRRYGGGGGGGSGGSGGSNIISGSSIGGHHHRRRDLSPVPDHYQPRIREPSRDIYPEDEREHVYKRNYAMEVRYPSRERDSWHNTREIRNHELHETRNFRDVGENHYGEERDRERERLLRDRERPPASGRNDWKGDWERNDWDESGGGGATPGRAGFVPKRGLSKHQSQSNVQQVQQRAGSESNWDTDEQDTVLKPEPEHRSWIEHGQRERPRPWQKNDWRDPEDGFSGNSLGIGGSGRAGSETGLPGHMSHQQSVSGPPSHHISHPRSERGGRGFRRGGGHHSSDHLSGERSSGYRPHPPPLMTLPVQPPGGYHSAAGGGGSGSTRGFLPKRLTYTNPGYGKKHMHPHSAAAAGAAAAATAAAAQQRHSPQPTTTPIKSSSAISSSSAQASAVAAATTAVAAAKAAAQSSANATTNPGILGKVSKIHATSGNSNVIGNNNTYTLDAEAIKSKTSETTVVALDDKLSGGELSEISDSDDDILNKTEKVRAKSDEPADDPEPLDAQLELISTEESKSESTGTANSNGNGNTCSLSTITSSSSITSISTAATAATEATAATAAAAAAVVASCSTEITNKPTEADDEVLDFEEISDGELEEDARLKGIGDALGVDWQGLIAETRAQAAEYASAQKRNPLMSGKQSWLPYHIILDVGVSLRMAGTYYGQQLLNDARLRLQEEHKEAKRQEELRKQAKKAAAIAAAAAAAAAEAAAKATAALEAAKAAAAAEAAKTAATATDPSSSSASSTSSSSITTTTASIITETSSGSGVNATELYNGNVSNSEAIKPSPVTLKSPQPLVHSHSGLFSNDINIDSDEHDEDEEADEVPFVSSVAEPLAYVQIAVRKKMDERPKLVTNFFDPHNPALGAGTDLLMRRHFMSLRGIEPHTPQTIGKISDKMKARALYLFQGHRKYKCSKELLDKVKTGKSD